MNKEMNKGDTVFIGEDKYICIGEHPVHGAMGLLLASLIECQEIAQPEDIVPADECEFRWIDGAWYWIS